jgi:signal transduction histidine kinase
VTARRGEALSRRDVELLDQIGRYVALATEAIRTTDDLLAAQHALKNAHADERRRLRMDLHDGLGPTLAAVRLKLVAQARTAPQPGPVTEAAEQVSDAIRELRRIVDGLQPSIVEDLGLVPAVQILIAEVQRTSGITFMFETPEPALDVPARVAATAYRTVAELVANVARHSAATSCRVTITRIDGSLDLTVEDDGRGFDPNAPAGGMGLRSIATRARDVGGDAVVTSVAGHGTKVAARLPIGVAS